MTSVQSLRRRVDKLQRARAKAHVWGGPTTFVEVRLSEPVEIREARESAAEAEVLANGWRLPPGVDDWYPGCGVGPMLIIVELDDREELQ